MNRGARRFQAIQRIARKKENDAAARFGQARRQRDEARQRLRELQDYRAEYLDRYAAAVAAGEAAARLQEYQVFITRLEQAIAEQQRILARRQMACEQARQTWNGEYTHSRAIGRVVERKTEEEAQDRARREQRLIDDRGVRNK